MAEPEHQAGSWLGDLTNEWKHAKPPEKAFIVIAVLGVAGIAYYVYTKNQGAATSTTNAPGASTAGTTGATTDNGTGGIPTIPQGSTPILPAGYSPIYDASGNVVGYQQGGQALTGTQPAPATSPTPAAGTIPPTGNLSSGVITQYINPPTPAVFGQTKLPTPAKTQVAKTASKQATPLPAKPKTCPAGYSLVNGSCVKNAQPIGSNPQTTASKLKVAQAGNLPAGGPH